MLRGYGGLLGLEEKPAPPELIEQGIVRFEAAPDDLELHFRSAAGHIGTGTQSV